MKFIFFFDALILFGLITFVYFGTLKGCVHELFGFFGAFLTLLIAMQYYRFLIRFLPFDIGVVAKFWTTIFGFIILLAFGWLVCYVLNKHLQKRIKDLYVWKTLNHFLGFFLGLFKGGIVAYLFSLVLMATGVTQQDLVLNNQLESSYCYRGMNILENHYHVLDRFAKIRMLRDVRVMYESVRAERIASGLIKEGSYLREQLTLLFVWLSLDESHLEQLKKSRELRQFFQALLKIPKVKYLRRNNKQIKRILSQKNITNADIFAILKNPAVIDLFKQPSIILLMKKLDFKKIKS